MSRTKRVLASLALVCMAVACGSNTSKGAQSLDASQLPDTIAVRSSAFVNGGPIPRSDTCDGPGNEPTISWGKVANGTKSVAVVVDDPDAPGGTFVHWLVIGLPPVPGTVPSKASGVFELDNTGGTRGWTPPCPPAGATHHYRFTVYALNDYVCANNADEAGTPGCSPPAAADALSQIRGTAIAKGTVVGTYRKQ